MEAFIAAVQSLSQLHADDDSPRMLVSTALRAIVLADLGGIAAAPASFKFVYHVDWACAAAMCGSLADASHPATLRVEGLMSAALCDPIATDGDIECVALCFATVHSALSPRIINLALQSLRTGSESAAMPLAAAVAVLAHLAQLSASSEAPLQADTRDEILRSAFAALRVVHNKQGTLQAITRRVVVPLSTGVNAATWSRSSVVETVASLVGEGFGDDAVLLIAALFDLLFPPHAEAPSPAAAAAADVNDFRRSDLLWTVITGAIQRVTESNEDPSKRQSLHNQVIYLLKRIVSYSDTQLGVPKDRSAAGAGRGKCPRARSGPSGAPKIAGEPVTGGAEAVHFHKCFTFHPHRSAQTWNTFFLIFESQTEYGLHLVEPAMAQLADLIADGLEPIWVEAVLLKGLVHPNVGCRRLTLRHLWRLPVRDYVATSFSRKFVCDSVFTCLADARLCIDIDSVVAEGSFLDCKAFEGRLERTLPPLQPIAELAEHFYREYVAAMPTIEEARDAVVGLLRVATSPRISRFGLSVLLRILAGVDRCVADEETLKLLLNFLNETVEDRHAHWLEARMCALVAESALRLSSPELLASPTGTALLNRCTRNGCTGGRAMTAIDSSGCAGNGGSAVRATWLAARLLREDPAIAAALVAGSTEALERLFTGSIGDFKLAEVKWCLSTPVLLQCALNSSGVAGAAQLAVRVRQQCESVAARPYASRAELIVALSAFVELSATLQEMQHDGAGGSVTWAAFLTPMAAAWDEAFARMLFDFLRRLVVQRMERCLADLTDERKLEGLSSSGDPTSMYDSEKWHEVALHDWDVIAAAVFHVLVRIATPGGDGVAHVGLASFTSDLLRLMRRCSVAVRPGLITEYGRIAVFRNLARMVHAVSSAHTISPFDLQHAFGPDHLATATTLALDIQPLHLSVDDVPIGALTTSNNCSTVIAQSYRYQWDTVGILLQHLAAEGESSPQAREALCASPGFGRLRDTALAQLDMCAVSNLSCVSSIAFTLLPFVENAREVVSIMRGRINDGVRRELFRCTAFVCFAAACRLPSEEAVEMLNSLLDESADTDRVVYFIACAVSASVVEDPATHWRAFRQVLLRLAVLNNSVNDDGEASAALAVMEPPVAASWPQELRATLPPVVRVHGAARCVALTAILHLCEQDPSIAVSIVEELVAWNTEHPVLCHEPAMPNSRHQRARLRAWQIICAAFPVLPCAALERIVPKIISTCIPINNGGSVRRLMELFLTQSLKAQPVLLTPCVVEALRDLTVRPQTTGSVALVAAHFVMEFWDRDELVAPFMAELIRLCSSQQHLLRIISHLAVHRVLKQRHAAGRTFTAEVAALLRYFEGSAESKKLADKHLGAVVFDAAAAMTPLQLFCVQRVEAEQWLQDACPASAFHRFAFLDKELGAVLGCLSPFEWHRCRQLAASCGLDGAGRLPERVAAMRLIPPLPVEHRHFMDYAFEAVYHPDTLAVTAERLATSAAASITASAATNGNSAAHGDADSRHQNMQRKVVSWWNSALHDQLHPRALGANFKQSITIVTTFLSNPVNVAGLMRCGEIFAAERVVVPDRSVFKSANFIAAARSAELWLPWSEVAEPALPQYLQAMRAQGYTIVGVEQTANSVDMTSFSFPKRVVMVLGSEGHGIPSYALPLLDICVEIPQYGLIRSFNVHVTGALVLYEYTKQRIAATAAAT